MIKLSSESLISVSFLITGKYKKHLEKTVFKNLRKNKNSKWNICISDTPWVHDFTQKNYCTVNKWSKQLEFESEKKSFLKISRIFTLRKIEGIDVIGLKCFKEITVLIKQ